MRQKLISAIAIVIIILSVLISGCGSNDVTGDVVKDTSAQCPVCEVTKCPNCPSCPVCTDKECPACPDCADFAISDDPVKLDLRDVKLLITEGQEYEFKMFYTDSEFPKLESAVLSFVPECEDIPNPIEIRVNDKLVQNKVPDCDQFNKVDLDIKNLDDGKNIVTFVSDAKDSYEVDDIEVKSTFIGVADETQRLGDFEFKDEYESETELQSLSNIEITNYKEFSVELDDDEAEKDMILEFSGENREGYLVVLVNDEKIFAGKVSRRDNRILIPAEKLNEGDNYITFVGLGS